MLSAALVQNGAHRNIALSIVNIIGARSGARIVIGFTLVAALLSMCDFKCGQPRSCWYRSLSL